MRPLPLVVAVLALGLVPVGSLGTADAAPKARTAKKPSPAKAAAKKAPTVKLKASEPVQAEATAQATGAPPSRGPTRIDFDDRLIQGQTNKSGAVYLYDRKELKTRSMVNLRESFRDEIVSSVYDS
jgi:hypothetical protein